MRLVLYTLFLGLLSVLVEMHIPNISALGGARPYLPALVIIYAAITLRGMRVFFVTVPVGFYADLLCQNRPGVSVIGLSVVTALILTQTQGRLLKRLDFQMLAVLVGSFLFLSLDYLFYLMQIWSGASTQGDWILITYGSIMNALLSPLLFACFNLPVRLFHVGSGARQNYTSYAAR